MTRAEHLVSVAELAPTVRGCGCSTCGGLADAPGEGRRRYAEGHLPGARFLDLEEVLTAHTGDPLDGRHPLPEVATLAAGLGALGVSDAGRHRRLRRARILRRGAGVVGAALGGAAGVRVLDGGLPAWVAAGLALETGRATAVVPTRLVLTAGQLPTIDVDAAAPFRRARGAASTAAPASATAARWSRSTRARGHIPGAVNVPAATLYDDGRMPADDRAAPPCSARLLRCAMTPGRGCYCGSGVSAARDVLALAVLGVDARSSPAPGRRGPTTPARPAALGPDRPAAGRTLDTDP